MIVETISFFFGLVQFGTTKAFASWKKVKLSRKAKQRLRLLVEETIHFVYSSILMYNKYTLPF